MADNKTINECVRNIKEAIERYEIYLKKTVSKELNIAEKRYEKEAIKLYDSYIRQYYRYKTKKYSRHFTGIGTGTGKNLFFAKDFEMDSFSISDDVYTVHLDELNIEFNPDKMKDDNYTTLSKKEIFDLVMHGHRAHEGWNWYGKYKSKYFSYDGTPIDAFEEFKNGHDEIIISIIGNKLKNKLDKRFNKSVETIANNLAKMER